MPTVITGAAAFDEAMKKALMDHAENPTPETQAVLVRLYESGSGYKGGCGACRNGRNLFIRGLATGDLSLLRGGLAAVKFKLSRLKGTL